MKVNTDRILDNTKDLPGNQELANDLNVWHNEHILD